MRWYGVLLKSKILWTIDYKRTWGLILEKNIVEKTIMIIDFWLNPLRMITVGITRNWSTEKLEYFFKVIQECVRTANQTNASGVLMYKDNYVSWNPLPLISCNILDIIYYLLRTRDDWYLCYFYLTVTKIVLPFICRLLYI